MEAGCVIFHNVIGAADVKEANVEMTSEEICTPVDNYDLLETGNKYFNVTDLEYKSKQQLEFTPMVLLSNDKKST